MSETVALITPWMWAIAGPVFFAVWTGTAVYAARNGLGRRHTVPPALFAIAYAAVGTVAIVALASIQ